MAEACFSIWGTTRDQTIAAIAELALPKNASGQYNHDDIVTFIRGVTRVLKSTFNPIDAGNGMEALMMRSNDPTAPSALSAIKSTQAATVASVLAKLKAKAAAKSSATGTTVAPEIETRTDAQAEADRLNQAYQAVIGAKEGAMRGIVAKVGTAVTDAVLCTPDGVDVKGVNEYKLYDVTEAAIARADQLAITNILELLSGVINFRFNFCKKVNQNVEILCSRAGRIKSYGITVDKAQPALVILANIETAAKEDYGSEFRPALQVIRRKYRYNHVHDDRFVAYILQTCAGADQVQQLNDAPPPRTDSAVANAVSQLSQLLQGPEPLSDEENTTGGTSYGTAAAATSDSEESEGGQARRGRKKKRAKDKRGSRSKSRRSKGKKNPCRHCRKFGRRRQHPNIPIERCFYNRNKRWRPRGVCNEMDIPFKPRDWFEQDSDGASDSDDSRASKSS